MGKHLKFAARCMMFAGILCICTGVIYRLITPKFFFDNEWPTTSTYLGFYEMEENTVDVLFLGSSHAASSFIPQKLYDDYKITSYNLGCEQQNLITSYYWLREALRYQKPEAVVLECFMLFPYNEEEPLNTAESCTRKAFDYMKWSSVKKEAVKTICDIDSSQSLLGYYFPHIRYHTRWKYLSENDFTFSDMANHYELKGYTPEGTWYGGQEYQPFEAEESKEEERMDSLMREYLDKITELCAQEGISLILVKTPTVLEDTARFHAVQKYAKDHELFFLDLNEKSLYEEIDFSFSVDNEDDEHANLWGAQKITGYIGEVLAKNYGIGGKADAQWENTKSYYEKIQKDCGVIHIENIDEYLAALQDKRYDIFISSKDDFTACLGDSTLQKLRELGLQAVMQKEPGCNYLAVVSEGEIVEQADSETLTANGSVRNYSALYGIISGENEAGSLSSIKLDGTECSKNHRGLNIVVYNHDTMKLVDSVCFDTSVKENPAIR